MRRTVEQHAITVLLSALGVVIVYRAFTQSITYDEAFTCLAFLSGEPSLVFTRFTANNHVLFSVAAKLTTEAFGVSAFALRLPAMLAGLACLWLAAAVCRRALGRGLAALLATAALCLNPFILDFLVAGRGYGMALAFMMLAFCLLLGLDGSARDRRRWAYTSLALGLSAAANLTFLLPAVALTLVGIGMEAAAGASIRSIVPRATLPGLLAGGMVLARPLAEARAEHFAYGTDALSQTALSLVAGSVRHDRPAWPADPEFIDADRLVVFFLVALVVPMLLWARALPDWLLHARTERNHPAARLTLLAAGTIVLTLAMLVVAHTAFGVRYPFGRTGLFLTGLVTLMLAGISGMPMQAPVGRPWMRQAAIVALTLLVARSAMQFETRYFYHWRFDAGTHDLFRTIVERTGGRGNVRVAVADVFAPAMSFYNAAAPAPLNIDSEGWLQWPTSYNFFVVPPATSRELTQVRGMVLRILATHPTSGAVLMENVVPLADVPIVR
jgi:hypothetical protein